MQDFTFPRPENVRNCISTIAEKPYQLCLMTQYLYCGRISEVIGEKAPSDNTVPRGPTKTDVRQEKYYDDRYGTLDVAVFTVRTAKRKGIIRNIALPFDKRFEPWTEEIFTYFQQSADGEKVFPFNRQKIWRYTRKHNVWKKMTYPVEKYSVDVVENGIKITKTRDRHVRRFTLHALRHLRATELVESYGFDGQKLSTYGGWTLPTMSQIRSPVTRYLHLDWRSYFPNLLVERS